MRNLTFNFKFCIYNNSHDMVFFLSLQGMSEEAVRQTRSQKRALERDAAPQSIEPANSDNENKKPKLDPSEPGTQAKTTSHPTLEEDSQIRTGEVSKHEKDQEKEESQLLLSSVLPLASQQVKDDCERTQRREMVEPSSDNLTECNDRASKLKTEAAIDTRSRAQLMEPKVSGGMLAAGEVKATIKVELQTGEQPVDMSTSRG